MDLEALRKIPKNRILVFDLEHTGEAKPEILQFSAVWATGREAFNMYVRPTKAKSWDRTVAIHHITPDMVKDAPTIKDIRRYLQNIFLKAKVIVGFSTDDDFRVLRINRFFMPKGNKHIHIDISKPFNDLYGDKVEQGKKYNCKSLKTCADYYGYHGDEWHYSLADAFATAMCFDKMLANGDLAYVAKNKKPGKEKTISMQTKMKGSKANRKKKQERRRQTNKRMDKKPIAC